MSKWRLVGQSLRYYWQTQLAVCLGVIVGTATIAGAMIVGDSMRSSLRQMTLDRLGPVDFVVAGQRLFRQELASQLQDEVGDDATIVPALVMPAGVTHQSSDLTRRAGQVSVYGVEENGWRMLAPEATAQPANQDVVLNEPLAKQLGVNVGDEVTIWLEIPSTVPRDSLLGQKDRDAAEIPVTVSAILPENTTAARFSLQPNQQLPFNAFVSLDLLQDRLDLAELRPNRSDPVGAPARVNLLLIASQTNVSTPETAQPVADRLETAIAKQWQLSDLNLRLAVDQQIGVLSLESDRMLLEDQFATAAQRAGRALNVPFSPVMVYLANWLENAKDPKAYSMYSTVAGLDVLSLKAPFGPFEFIGEPPSALGRHEVLINEFLAEDLKVHVGDSIKMGYHIVGSYGELPEEELTVTVRGIVRLTGPAADQGLTPTVKGITDVDSLSNWDQPFPMDLDRVTSRDDAYWETHRATPKMFFPLGLAQRLWPSRYGALTSIRLAPLPGKSPAESQDLVAKEILSQLTPAGVGMAAQPVKAYGLQAASGSTDFTGLFIGFSLFLIAAAIILVGLLFRVGIEQRVRNLGLLAALGFTSQEVRRQMLLEGFLVVTLGGIFGALAAVGYANLMIYGLKTWWVGAVGTKFLFLDVQPLSLIVGAISSILAALIAIFWGLRQLRLLSVREQLQGIVEPPISLEEQAAQGRRSRCLALVLAIGAVLLVLGVIVGVIPAKEAFSGLSWQIVVFFVSGIMLLSASLFGLSGWLAGESQFPVTGTSYAALGRLGLRNASRSRLRSVMSTGLIASATFLIVAVAAGQKNPAEERPDKASGNGGFTLVADSASPILYDLNSDSGREKLNLLAENDPANAELLKGLNVLQFRMKPGEEASCLNLYQTTVPTILGVPDRLIERGGFKFIGASPDNPWLLLQKTNPDGTIPVFGDMNTLMFSLKKGPGAIVNVPTENGDQKLRIAGMLDGSIFQGVLLMSDRHFQTLFPDQKGFRYFLVETPLDDMAAASDFLESRLAVYGFDAEPVAQRLAKFLAVQNTYLSTFQSLGGLGLLLGTFGLATVMLRNVLERKSEIALLRAVGYQSTGIAWLILCENTFLLLWGLISGTAAALLAMLPHLLGTGAEIPWLSGSVMLLLILATGTAASLVAIRTALSAPIVTTLRGE